jgi:hypothetical protein
MYGAESINPGLLKNQLSTHGNGITLNRGNCNLGNFWIPEARITFMNLCDH